VIGYLSSENRLGTDTCPVSDYERGRLSFRHRAPLVNSWSESRNGRSAAVAHVRAAGSVGAALKSGEECRAAL
jgi:hypothetical protein